MRKAKGWSCFGGRHVVHTKILQESSCFAMEGHNHPLKGEVVLSNGGAVGTNQSLLSIWPTDGECELVYELKACTSFNLFDEFIGLQGDCLRVKNAITVL